MREVLATPDIVISLIVLAFLAGCVVGAKAMETRRPRSYRPEKPDRPPSVVLGETTRSAREGGD